ncbi:MAG: MFS transporter, partial [Actinobacteria bacterium]|nr:MFS transporter [Actinomycetota bacterium]
MTVSESLSVWSNRDFRLVLGGGFVNNVGDWLLAVALPAFVYIETGSGRATAAIVVIELLVAIVWGPYGGSLVDRWDLRRTVILTNVLQAICLVPLLAVTADRVWPAFIVAGVQGLLREVNAPASFALVPRIVPAEQLTAANAANAAGGSLARLIGSPIQGGFQRVLCPFQRDQGIGPWLLRPLEPGPTQPPVMGRFPRPHHRRPL